MAAPFDTLRAAVGADAVRFAPDSDRATNLARPSCVVEPRDVDGVCATMAWAAAHGMIVRPRGGGSKIGWGRPPTAVDVTLGTHHLTGVVDHADADLTATVRAGTPLADVNRALAAKGQWIPLDPLGTPAATIGGVLACNDSGPRRHRYGAPRDVLIGVTFVTAEGTRARSGGRVVKNVAGYDLGRLLTGSHGSLGVIVEATFKLSPLPAASRTVTIGPSAIDRIAAVVRAVADSQLAPSAIEVAWPPARALVRFETVAAAAVRQASDAVDLATSQGIGARVVEGAEEDDVWRAHAESGSRLVRAPDAHDEVAQFRVGVPPASLGAELEWLHEALSERAIDGAFVGRAALGMGRVTLGGAREALVDVVGQLQRRYEAVDGYVMMLVGSQALRAIVDPWGPLGDAPRVMDAVKQQFDPNGTLGSWCGGRA